MVYGHPHKMKPLANTIFGILVRKSKMLCSGDDLECELVSICVMKIDSNLSIQLVQSIISNIICLSWLFDQKCY